MTIRLSTTRQTLIALAIGFSLFFLGGCSDSETDTKSNTDTASDTSTTPQNTAQQPATPSTPANQSTTPMAANLPSSGKVIKAMHAGGYTYMELEDDGKHFWIAATMLNVKRNDRVAWADAAVMKNFKSSSLRRTFDEILFVSAAEVEK